MSGAQTSGVQKPGLDPVRPDAAAPAPPPGWHAAPVETVLADLSARPEGLAEDEAARRLAHHGPNRLPEAAPRGAIARFLAQFNAILLLLLASAGVALALRHWVDAAVIVGGVFI